MKKRSPIKSVAVIGAGASGAATAAALKAEDVFDTIRVFERRASPGGTWIYDTNPGPLFELHPGGLPPETDPPLDIPEHLPTTTPQSSRQRYDKTPIYEDLTTNVPAIAMSFSDIPFPYGPFVPHWIPKQYIANYFSAHRIDLSLVSNTTVEDVSKLPSKPPGLDRWSLTLRKNDPVRGVDEWWKEEFDALVIANGHYSVPFVPKVKGLDGYLQKFPHRISHSKVYRTPQPFTNKRVLVIGNSASGHDITASLLKTVKLPVYNSRRSHAKWEGPKPPSGVEWKPIITEFVPSSGSIVFSDGSVLTDIDHVIYCTGYKVSFPFWNTHANGGKPIWDYENSKVFGSYLHTFFQDHPTLAIVGLPRFLTFRGFEYQAIAVARVFAGRNAEQIPSKEEQEKWESERWELARKEKRGFHDLLPWECGETLEFLRTLYELAGLPLLEGKGRVPPCLDERTRWALENVKKYEILSLGNGEVEKVAVGVEDDVVVDDGWTVLGSASCREE